MSRPLRAGRAALLPTLVALGCAGAPAPAAAPAGAPAPLYLWEVRDPGGRVVAWLFGSVHVGAEAAVDPQVMAAHAAAARVVFEIDMSPEGEAAAAAGGAARLRYGPGGSLASELPAALVQRLHQAAAAGLLGPELRAAPAAVDQLRPWALGLMLTAARLGAGGDDAPPEPGLDRAFAAASRGREPFEALETVDEQLDLLASEPAAEVQEGLQALLDAPQEAVAQFETLQAAYRRGDDAALLELIRTSADASPAARRFLDDLFTRRNHRMAERLAARLDTATPRFVVLGAGHLIGEQGVPALLARAGWSVTRRHSSGAPVPVGLR